MNTILAADRNWGIGRDGGLLTHLPEDMKYFRTTTKDKVVVMGRKTLESFPGGNPLKNRVNIVLTADKTYKKEGVLLCHNIEEVLEELKKYQDDQIYIIGGGVVYKEFLPYCNTAYVTALDADLQPDTWFPDLNKEEGWVLKEKGEEKEYEGLKFRFTTYINENAKNWR